MGASRKLPRKALIQAYQDIANFTRKLCEKHCITRDGHIGSCCDKMYCEIALERAAQYGIELKHVSQRPAFLLNDHGCTIDPWLRPMCAVHVCDKCIYFNIEDYNEYFRLRNKVDELEWKEHKDDEHK
jgi:hypothetical protein